MATIDPLKLLREYALDSKPIKERDNHILFGEIAFPKDVKTNFVVYGKQNEYYTLESLYFFYQKRDLNHASYVREAVGRKLQVVTRPDRKDLIDYLTNRAARPPASIDVTVTLPVPVTLRPQRDHDHHHHHDAPEAKRSKLDEVLSRGPVTDKHKVKSTAPLRDLSHELTADKLAELKSKVATRRRGQIRGTEDDLVGAVSEVPTESVGVDSDALDREIKQRERVWKTRTSCMAATAKNFQKSIFPILHQLKIREEAAARGPPKVPDAEVNKQQQQRNAAPSQGSAQAGYSRYDQERFRENTTEGFQIDTTGTYHGVVLKDMMSQGVKPRVEPSPSRSKQAPSAASAAAVPGANKKRTSRTPIIIIPAANTSLITMYNCSDILQDLHFVLTDEKKAKGIHRTNECFLQRKKDEHTTVPFRVVDNPLRLAPDEWERVVAVFAQGPAWQFKNWPWKEPTQLLQEICGFHLKWDETKTDGNIAKWPVTVLSLSKTRRHLDRATLLKFWQTLDKYIAKHKPHLRY